MALYKQAGSCNWWVDVYRGKGRRRLRFSTGTEDRAEAAAIEAATKAAVQGNPRREYLLRIVDAIAPPEGPVLRVAVAAVMETYLAQPQVEIAASTERHVRSHVGRFAAWVTERYPRVEYLDQVTRGIAHEYAEGLRAELSTGKTYNNHRGSLCTVWNALIHRAGLAENVWSTVPTASTRDSRERRAYTREEEERIFEAAAASALPGDWYGAALVARYTGLRQGDVFALGWDCIEGDTLRIDPAKTRRHKIKVSMPLHRRVIEYLATKPRRGDLIFPELWKRYAAQRRGGAPWRSILQAAGVEDDTAIVDFHSWRHTWRTRFSEAGGSLEDAKLGGGWATDAMARHYNHDLSGLRRAIEAMD